VQRPIHGTINVEAVEYCAILDRRPPAESVRLTQTTFLQRRQADGAIEVSEIEQHAVLVHEATPEFHVAQFDGVKAASRGRASPETLLFLINSIIPGNRIIALTSRDVF
jgi:hypothetical protein